MEKHNWDLKPILKNKSLYNWYQELIKYQNKIINDKKNCLKSLNHFIKWLKLCHGHEIIDNVISTYVSNNKQENLANETWIGWEQKLIHNSIQFKSQTSDLHNIYLKNKETIIKYLEDSSIKKYQRAFNQIFRFAPHILDDKSENLLVSTSQINHGFSDVFDTLTDVDIKFDDAINKNNKHVPIKTISDVTKFLKDPDRTLRKSTWISFNSSFNKFENTLTQLLYFNYKMLNSYARIRHFSDYIDEVSFSDEIETKFILTLFKNVEHLKPLTKLFSKKINKLLKQFLHISKVEPWDKSVDIVKTKERFSIARAQKIILNTFSLFGKEYTDVIKKAFSQKWISWLAKPNKQTGAYSIGPVTGVNRYYISMNYTNTIESLFTIAHELGHSVHAYFIAKKQDVYDSVSIFCAEIPSIVNEVLLAYWMLENHKDNKDICRWIRIELLNNFFNTVTRQIIFSNTEYDLNEKINSAQPLTKNVVHETYLKNIKKYTFMSNKQTTYPYNLALSTILRIPHFYVGNFYVYKYAIGQIVAIKIATDIYKKNKIMLTKYFDFLSLGTSLSPIDCIKKLGIDFSKKKLFDDVYKIVKSWINDLDN